MLSLKIFSNFVRGASVSATNHMATTFAKPQIPQKPKKPIIPWVAFVRERKDDVLRQKSKMTAAEMSVILAREWKQIDKTRYQEEFERMQQEYNRKMQDYENSLTEEQRDYLNQQKDLKRNEKAKKLLRKTKPPVLPRNPANLYCHVRSKQDDIREKMKYHKPSEVFKDIFREYRELSEDEKKKYIDMQEEDKLRFQHEFLAWYESIQNNENLTKAAREKADAMRDRFKSLEYI